MKKIYNKRINFNLKTSNNKTSSSNNNKVKHKRNNNNLLSILKTKRINKALINNNKIKDNLHLAKQSKNNHYSHKIMLKPINKLPKKIKIYKQIKN